MYGYTFTNNTEVGLTINRQNAKYSIELVMLNNGTPVTNFITPLTDVAKNTGSNLTFDVSNSWTITDDKQINVNYTGLQLINGDEITFKYRVFSVNDLLYTDSATVGAGSDVPLTQFEDVSIVTPGFTIVEFIVRINKGVVPIGETVKFELYAQTSSITSAALVPTVSITLTVGQFCGTISIFAPVLSCSALAVKVTPTYSLAGASSCIKFFNP